MGFSDVTVEAKWFFQFAFCAVSLAIVWGTTLERIKFGVYVIYAIMFAAIIYPIGAHWVFGGGWLQANIGMQDFAGSTAVHLIGATGGLAVLLLLGARKGKYGGDGKPRPIPGHNMPMFGLGVLILWLGWFGFNPGSTLGALDGRFAEVALVTQLACAAGVIAAAITSRITQKTHRHRHGRQRRDRGPGRDHGSVRLRRGVGGTLHRCGGRRPGRAGHSGDRQADRRSRSAPCRRTAWPASGARCRAASSPHRGSPTTTRSASPTVTATSSAASSTPAACSARARTRYRGRHSTSRRSSSSEHRRWASRSRSRSCSRPASPRST